MRVCCTTMQTHILTHASGSARARAHTPQSKQTGFNRFVAHTHTRTDCLRNIRTNERSRRQRYATTSATAPPANRPQYERPTNTATRNKEQLTTHANETHTERTRRCRRRRRCSKRARDRETHAHASECEMPLKTIRAGAHACTHTQSRVGRYKLYLC